MDANENDYTMSYEDSMAGMLDEARARARQLRAERVELRAKCEDLEVWRDELCAKLEVAERERAALRTENAELRLRLEAVEPAHDNGTFQLPDEARGFRLPDERPQPSTAPLAGRKEG